jgi:TolB protein
MRSIARTLLCLCLLLPLSAAAQITIEITGGAVGAVPIAVVPFRTAEGTGSLDTDVAEIVRSDLYRTGLFDTLPPSNFITQPASSEEVRYQNWRALGADYLVVGRVERSGTGYEVSFELMDVYGARVLASKRYVVPPNALRITAHTIANEIFRTLTGRPGGFNSRLLYVREQGSGDDRRYQLIYAEADSRNPQAILTSESPIMSPVWGPERERLAYVSFENGRSEIYVQEVRTGQRRKVASFPGINSAPAFSPDGESLAMSLSRDGSPDIVVLDLDSGETRRLTSAGAIDTEPVWSPDGEWIYFTSDRGGNPQIYRIPANGGDVSRVTYEGNYNASPDISPTGDLLAMVHRGEGGGFRIAVQDLETGLVNVLTDGPLDESPTFAPNGAMLAYTRVDGDRTELATVSVHGRANDTLTRTDAEVREPAWSAQ